MARIRTIKPEFWTSEQVLECSPIARLMFIGLWNFADDTGRHKVSARAIKAEIFPGDDIASENILRMIAELERNGLVQRYTIENVDYLQITGWHHQRIDKPQPAKYPEPPRLLEDHSKNAPRTLPPDTIRKDTIRKDTKGEDTKRVEVPADAGRANGSGEKPKRATRLPADWPPSPDLIRWARDKVPRVDIHRETEKFRNYWTAKAGKDGAKLDWNATWRNWMLSADERLGSKAQAPPTAAALRDPHLVDMTKLDAEAPPGWYDKAGKA